MPTPMALIEPRAKRRCVRGWWGPSRCSVSPWTSPTVYPCVDPDLVIAEYTSQGEVIPTGRRYSNRYIGLWRFRDGKVCFTREYLNPEIARAAMAPADD